MSNADTIQDVINQDLFPSTVSIADVKQVLEFMTHVAQPISEAQVRALILLQALGSNVRLHGTGDPYKDIREKILGTKKETGEFKKAVARSGFYLDTIEELIPKPPKVPKPTQQADTKKKGGK